MKVTVTVTDENGNVLASKPAEVEDDCLRYYVQAVMWGNNFNYREQLGWNLQLFGPWLLAKEDHEHQN